MTLGWTLSQADGLLMFQADGLVLSQADGLLLGKDFLPWMVLAFGAAMVAGNVLALFRPPKGDDGQPREGEGPPIGRAVAMIVIGGVAAVWGIASLLS